MIGSDHTKLSSELKRYLECILEKFPGIQDIARAIHARGGRSLLVGGTVRDLLRAIHASDAVSNVLQAVSAEQKDLDIEVHGLTAEQLESVLKEQGPVDLIGKSFGVFRLHGLNADWSLPRTDSVGRKPTVKIDPALSMQDAFARRDLTVNAIGVDLISFELIDPFNGVDDLRQGILRSPDLARFADDPLRFYRVMQFVGRLNMIPDDALNAECTRMDISQVSRERIDEEFRKLFLRSGMPSAGLRWVHQIGRLQEILPELAATVGVEQDPVWHPEGDVFEHTMQACDAAAAIAHDAYTDAYDRLTLLFATLCHDLGKVQTTERVDGRLRSHGHEGVGADMVSQVLARMTVSKNFSAPVSKLVRYHMVPIQFIDEDASLAVYRRLADKLAPHTTLRMLANLSCADKRGRNSHAPVPLTAEPEAIKAFCIRAQEAKVFDGREEPVLQGRDLLDVIPAGERLGQLLRYAYRVQIEEGVTDKAELRQRTLEAAGSDGERDVSE